MNDHEYLTSLLKDTYSNTQKEAIISEFFKRSKTKREPDVAFLYSHIGRKLDKGSKKRLKRVIDSTEYINLNSVTDQKAVVDKVQAARDRGNNIILSGNGNNVNLVGRDFIRGAVQEDIGGERQRRARNIGNEILRTAGINLGSKILQAIGNSIFPGLGTIGSMVIPRMTSFFKANIRSVQNDPDIVEFADNIIPERGNHAQRIVDDAEEPEIPTFLGFRRPAVEEFKRPIDDDLQSVYEPSEFGGYSVIDEIETAPYQELNDRRTKKTNETSTLLNSFLESMPYFGGGEDFAITPYVLKTAVNAGLSWALNNYSKR